jgi:hypothetical protein
MGWVINMQIHKDDPKTDLANFYRGISKLTGFILIVISLYGLIVLYFEVGQNSYADFPCYGFGFYPTDRESRISYGITFVQRNVISGGGCLARGESIENEVQIFDNGHFWPITIKRENDEILVNGQLLKVYESHAWWKASLSVNPWVIYTVKFEARNQGKPEITNSDDIIDFSGEFREGWLPNPLGIGIFILGFYMIRKNKNDTSPLS